MNAAEFEAAVAAAVDAHPWGTPGARKTGRRSEWPYVPILTNAAGHSGQIRGRAFATRDEAIADAAANIERARAKLAADLMRPNMRALRVHHGLPEEIPFRALTPAEYAETGRSHVYDPDGWTS
jgi:hypothetical protein